MSDGRQRVWRWIEPGDYVWHIPPGLARYELIMIGAASGAGSDGTPGQPGEQTTVEGDRDDLALIASPDNTVHLTVGEPGRSANPTAREHDHELRSGLVQITVTYEDDES